jgi:two-component sensor histidine kinase
VEQERLAALHRYAILDTAPEEAFERVVRLAHVLFGVPMAVVSLVDEKRQWFKAKIGVDASETPRDWAFCAHAIQQPDVMIVPDARLDPRFAANPLVLGEPFIRFYAGAPLRTPAGHALGTVCVISPEPRQDFPAQDQERLTVLAGIVANEMELRLQLERANRLAEENQILLREIHHRVGNSLQLVSDVLQLQMQRTRDPALIAALQNAIGRVNTVGGVHRQLYHGQRDGKADAGPYLSRLLQQLWRGLLPEASTRRILVDASGVMLEAAALPRLGLAATELVTNALKHGSGDVSVALRPETDGVRLTVSDEGPGFPPDFSLVPRGSKLGLLLVQMLATEDGVRIDPANRLAIEVHLPE